MRVKGNESSFSYWAGSKSAVFPPTLGQKRLFQTALLNENTKTENSGPETLSASVFRWIALDTLMRAGFSHSRCGEKLKPVCCVILLYSVLNQLTHRFFTRCLERGNKTALKSPMRHSTVLSIKRRGSVSSSLSSQKQQQKINKN